MWRWALSTFVLLAACVTTQGLPPSQAGDPAVAETEVRPSDNALRQFAFVVQRIEPVAERLCKENRRNRRCNFLIRIDARGGQPPNAFQNQDSQGRPQLVFTTALIQGVRNLDELAFVVGHEAAHHIAGHITQASSNALRGALLAGVEAEAAGLDEAAAKKAAKLGSLVAVQMYSKAFELEADALGAEIAFDAGFDPVKGAEFFDSLPDVWNRFLSSHPPNAQRKQLVRSVAAQLQRRARTP